MNNEVFFIIDNDNLYFEKALVTLDYPVLFICKSNFDRYLALCIDSDENLYLVAKERNVVIKKMLEKAITMREAFLNALALYTIKTGDSIYNDIVKKVEYDSLSNDQLPLYGAFYETSDISITNYINELESINIFQMNNIDISQLAVFKMENTIPFNYHFYNNSFREQIFSILSKDIVNDLISKSVVSFNYDKQNYESESFVPCNSY